jgi:hypothetical protein
MRLWNWRGLLGAAALFVGLAPATAQVPEVFTYTGELRADNGLPYNGTVSVSVGLFTTEAAVAPVWSADLGDIEVAAGALSVDITGGAGMTPSQLFTSGGARWLEFTIDGETLSPRQMVSTVPYAFRAHSADMLNGPLIPALSTPASPMDGQLWFDSASQSLKVWSSAESAWVSASPPDPGAVGQWSNGNLSNKFANALTWPGPAVNILDAEPASPPAAASASVSGAEAAGSYLTALSIQTKFGLNFNSRITMMLTPPAGSGVAPITLINAQDMLGGTYDQTWTPANTPALAALLNQGTNGNWTLAIWDQDNNAVGSPAVGALQAFSVSYDVVRSNQLAVSGDLQVAGNLTANGTIRTPGSVIRKVNRHVYARGHSTGSGSFVEVPGSSFTFTKTRGDTDLLINWNDNLRATSGSGASRCEWRIRLNDQDCSSPREMRIGLYSGPADNNIHYPVSFIQTCNQVAGAKLAAGNHEASIWVRAESGDCWTGHGIDGGAGLTTGLITVEEVY